MRTEKYHAQTLHDLLHKEKVATLDMMKNALKTTHKMTVSRKLQQLAYRASYSHAGKYYTLDEIAQYNRHGLWFYRQACFSKHGSLLKTTEALVCASEAGYFAHELQDLLRVRLHNSLLQLTISQHLVRENVATGYLYLSAHHKEHQLLSRKRMLEKAALSQAQQTGTIFDNPEIKNYLKTFLATLNEKQRRLFAGFESMKLGYGGDSILSRITGMNPKTISRGRKELASKKITVERVRTAGGGRYPVEKKAKS